MRDMPNAQLRTEDTEELAEELQLHEPVTCPVLIIISGLPGTGKTYFARRLAERLPLTIIESDAFRKVLFPSPTYSSEESACLFRVIHSLIKKLLKEGISLILDATNLSDRHLVSLYLITNSSGAKPILVSVEAPDETVRQRLETRPQDANEKSDADWIIYLRMKEAVRKIRRQHYTVDTSRNITPVLDKIVKKVRG